MGRSREEWIELAHAHATYEGAGEFDALLATLEADPVY